MKDFFYKKEVKKEIKIIKEISISFLILSIVMFILSLVRVIMFFMNFFAAHQTGFFSANEFWLLSIFSPFYYIRAGFSLLLSVLTFFMAISLLKQRKKSRTFAIVLSIIWIASSLTSIVLGNEGIIVFLIEDVIIIILCVIFLLYLLLNKKFKEAIS